MFLKQIYFDTLQFCFLFSGWSPEPQNQLQQIKLDKLFIGIQLLLDNYLFSNAYKYQCTNSLQWLRLSEFYDVVHVVKLHIAALEADLCLSLASSARGFCGVGWRGGRGAVCGFASALFPFVHLQVSEKLHTKYLFYGVTREKWHTVQVLDIL